MKWKEKEMRHTLTCSSQNSIAIFAVKFSLCVSRNCTAIAMVALDNNPAIFVERVATARSNNFVAAISQIAEGYCNVTFDST